MATILGKIPFIDLCYGTFGKVLDVELDPDRDFYRLKVRDANSIFPRWIENIPYDRLVQVPASVLEKQHPLTRYGLYVITKINDKAPLLEYLNLDFVGIVDKVEAEKERRAIQDSLSKVRERLALTRGTEQLKRMQKIIDEVVKRPKEGRRKERFFG